MMSRAQLPLEQGGTLQLARRGDVVELRTAVEAARPLADPLPAPRGGRARRRDEERPLGMTKSPETAPTSQETSGGLAALSACVFPEVSLKSANLSAGLCS